MGLVSYYFISSPLHLLLSANLALKSDHAKHTAVLVPRPGQPFSAFEQVLQEGTSPFSDVLSFESNMLNSKRAERKRRMQSIKSRLEQTAADAICTGTDRRVEFQYAMHIARKINPATKGLYVDDGMATYAGHKSSGNIAHRYLDPIGKKLAYGWWWDNPVTIGSSNWIDELHVAYPDFAHESLHHKKKFAIDKSVFQTERFQRFSESLLSERNFDSKQLLKLDALLMLTHESFYAEPVKHIENLINAVLQARPDACIGIKPHPRTQMLEKFKQQFPSIEFIDSRIGMELILPALPVNCQLIGDVSTALLTSRWFSEASDVFAVMLDAETIGSQANTLYELFDQLGIERTTIDTLAATLKS